MGMMMARRNLFALGGGWKNPYVANGLIAMWDGEWNDAPGVHDPNARVWKDLVGDDDLALRNCNFGPKALLLDSLQNACAFSSNTRDMGDMSLEVAFRDTRTNINHDLLSIDVSSGTGIVVYGGMNASSTLDWWVRGTDMNVAVNPLNSAVATSATISIGDGLIRMFRLGVPVASSPVTLSGVRGFVSLVSLRNASNRSCMTGEIYAVRLYSRALEPAEIAANYAIDKARFGLDT